MKKLGVTAVAWLLGAAWAGGQAPAARAPMAEEVFKNVQILKGIPVDEFMGTMGFFSASLGLNCTDCHVDESGGNWAGYADDNPKKQTARRMMQMVTALNRTSFGGRQVVTCNTCHRGNSRPNVQPSLALLYGTPPPDEPGEPITQAPGQPPAERVLDKVRPGGRRFREDLRDHILDRQGRVPRVRRSGQEHGRNLRESSRPAQHHRAHPLGRQHDDLRRPRRLDRRAGRRKADAGVSDHGPGAGRHQAGGGVVVSVANQAGADQDGVSARLPSSATARSWSFRATR